MIERTELCDRCNESEADHHLETMTTSECLCSHCVMVAMGLILAPPVELEFGESLPAVRRPDYRL